MKIYNWDKKTYIYLGYSEANKSPLEPGVYAIPAYATAVPIPDNIDNNHFFFWDINENKWESRELEQENNEEIDLRSNKIAQQLLRLTRNSLLSEVDWIIIKQYSMGLPVSEEVSNYMQQLRDLPSVSNPVKNSNGMLDMTSVNWPKIPQEQIDHNNNNNDI